MNLVPMAFGDVFHVSLGLLLCEDIVERVFALS